MSGAERAVEVQAMSEGLEAIRDLIRDLEAIYARAFRGGGHRPWCRKATRIGVGCTCGADDLARTIMNLRLVEGGMLGLTLANGQTWGATARATAVERIDLESPQAAGERDASAVWRCVSVECPRHAQPVELAFHWRGAGRDVTAPACPECRARLALVRVSK